MKSLLRVLEEDNGYLQRSTSVSLFAVDLRNCDPKDFKKFLELLGANSSLKSLSFRSCNLSECATERVVDLFQTMNQLTTLESLSLLNAFSAQSSIENFCMMSSLLQLRNLRTIDLGINFLFKHEKAVVALRLLFSKNRGLRTINLEGNELYRLPEATFYQFLDILSAQTFEAINLSANRLGTLKAPAFEHLFHKLSSIQTLSNLDLMQDDFEGKPLSVLNRFFSTSQLKTLNLSACNIGKMSLEPEDLGNIFKTLSHKNHIKVIQLGSNELECILDSSDEEVKILEQGQASDYLERWSVLERVNLSHNNFYLYQDALKFLISILLSRQDVSNETTCKAVITKMRSDFSNTGCDDINFEELLQQGLPSYQRSTERPSKLSP